MSTVRINKQVANTVYDLLLEKSHSYKLGLIDLTDKEIASYTAAQVAIAKDLFGFPSRAAAEADIAKLNPYVRIIKG